MSPPNQATQPSSHPRPTVDENTTRCLLLQEPKPSPDPSGHTSPPFSEHSAFLGGSLSLTAPPGGPEAPGTGSSREGQRWPGTGMLRRTR